MSKKKAFYRKHDIIIHGSEEDQLYVSDGARMCAVCGETKVVQQFHVVNKETGAIVTSCRKCWNSTRNDITATREVSATKAIVDTLTKATGRRELANLGPTLGEAMKSMIHSLGGEDGAFKKMADVIDKAFVSNDIDLALKATKLVMDGMESSQKMSPDPVDISSLTADEIDQLLMEPARKLILDDAAFRRKILNDPEIREALLEELGVSVIETSGRKRGRPRRQEIPDDEMVDGDDLDGDEEYSEPENGLDG